MLREVWTAEEATLTIWEIDSGGAILSPAFREESFARNVSCRPLRHNVDIQQPGCAFQDTYSRVIAQEIRIGSLFKDATKQCKAFEDNAGKRWRILIQFTNPLYIPAGLAEDQLDFRYAEAVEGPNVEYGDSGAVDHDLVFRAPFKTAEATH